MKLKTSCTPLLDSIFHRRSQTLVGAAALLTIYGAPTAVLAQQTRTESLTLEQVVVTASRREQTVQEVPYGITVVGPGQLADTGVTDIASLATQVPGLSMFQFGGRSSGTVNPTIRGINASTADPAQLFRTFEQSPVGMYIGNSPVDGYFQLDDVQRVEVLRGPQGTLYGAGALGGALRIIPNAPELNATSGSLEASVGSLSHSDDSSYGAAGMVNLPLGSTVALRASGKYEYRPGFVDVYGLMVRESSAPNAAPVAADPSDPAYSEGVFYGRKDWNDSDSFTGRASLLWQPTDRFNAQFAYLYAQADGNSSPLVYPDFAGGAFPLDPRMNFPAGGKYRGFSPSTEPYDRKTQLSSLDLSYDVGFATLSSTSSYFTSEGDTLGDRTYSFSTVPFMGYYGGTPRNPRFLRYDAYSESSRTFSQELRIVSAPDPDAKIDYVFGGFFQDQRRRGSWDMVVPGTPAYTQAQGCTGYYFFGATFPDCLVNASPADVVWHQVDTQQFQDVSIFGEVTWHFTEHGQVTFGARHFQQKFDDTQIIQSYPFNTFSPPDPISADASKNIYKFNPSYQYADGHFVYAVWSQGFRRGGANAVLQTGPFAESSPLLRSYVPDTTDNYEVGIKGTFSTGLTYSLGVFDIKWDKPQVSGSTPQGNLAVWNAGEAESKGVEFEISTPLFAQGLAISIGGAYTDSKFTQDYFIPSGLFGDIFGNRGQQLPGSPKYSGVATINYDRRIGKDYDLALSLNDSYRSGMLLSTFPIFGSASPPEIPHMNIVNFSAALYRGGWKGTLYATNLLDDQFVLAPPLNPGYFDGMTNGYTVNMPREVGLRLSRSFGD